MDDSERLAKQVVEAMDGTPHPKAREFAHELSTFAIKNHTGETLEFALVAARWLAEYENSMDADRLVR